MAEFIASLSLATDLGLGQPEEHVLRQTVIATRLAAAAGLSGDEQAAAFYVSLLAWVGCIADSHEMAHWFGDDLRLRADSYHVDKAGLPMLGFMLGHLGRLGVTGVSTGIWNKPGPLSASEWERVRMVPYLTERVLSRCDRLRPLGAVAGMCHERMDGSGYPRGVSGSWIPFPARLIAAADTFTALGQGRPHRAALPDDRRREIIEQEVAAGRLDADAVRTVLATAGAHRPRRASHIAGLTAREIEVLRLLVRGLSNKQIAQALSITSRTAGSHVEHIYTKIGVSTRGAAAMFAMRHGVVEIE
ncbi:MAG: hypothetical protein J2P18_00370 [Nocardia sp.]|nr:hypothetical protein [Nocardia sp.]